MSKVRVVRKPLEPEDRKAISKALRPRFQLAIAGGVVGILCILVTWHWWSSPNVERAVLFFPGGVAVLMWFLAILIWTKARQDIRAADKDVVTGRIQMLKEMRSNFSVAYAVKVDDAIMLIPRAVFAQLHEGQLVTLERTCHSKALIRIRAENGHEAAE